LRFEITSKVFGIIYASIGLQSSQFYLASARRSAGEEGLGAGRGGTCQDQAKNPRCYGAVGSLPEWKRIAFLGCQK